jgi:DNA-directed RNA polymerase beta' subunit
MTERREMVKFLDRLKKISFDYVTSSGISISPFELDNVVPSKEKMILDYSEKAKLVEDLYDRGFYSYEEKK